MQEVDVIDYRLVKAGVLCHVNGEVRTSTLIETMHSEDKYIYWFERGDVATQVSCEYVNNKYYSVLLHLEKAVFKHVRLSKHFLNSEMLEYGTKKLRIPSHLLDKKKFTSHCLKVMP